MKTLKITIACWVMIFMVSCSDEVKFPVSSVVPAADITATVKKQGKPNYLVTIEANNLAAPKRLAIPKKNYVVWAVSEKGIVRNVGHFTQENAVKATYKASFPYQPVEVFITAENEEGNCTPQGVEITRVRLIEREKNNPEKK